MSADETGVRRFRAEDEAAIRAIMEASLVVDELPGFEQVDIERALVRLAPDPVGTLVALEDGRVVGYCSPARDDLTVHPDHRRRGHGRRLVAAAAELLRRNGDDLSLYVPQHLDGARRFAESLGLRYRSSLWRLSLPIGVVVPAPRFPADVATRTFNPATDVDLEAWTAFLRASFEGHPTRISWSVEVIRAVNAAPGFDPTGILIVEPADRSAPIAFARIDLPPADGDGERRGDVALIGVLPEWRGRGIGRELLRWAVTELRGRGADRIDLSVEAANERATSLYRRHGFVPSIEWPHWQLGGDSGTSGTEAPERVPVQG